MEAWVFIVILAVMALGIGAGFAIGRSTNTAQRRSEALETEITELRGQLSDYRQQVAHHFAETADVVNAMTANYRALYDHLSKGAQDLCGEQFTSNKLDSSAMRFIEHSAEAPGTQPAEQAGAGEAGLAAAAAGATATAAAEAGDEPERAAGEEAAAAAEETPPAPASGPSHIADAMEKSAQAEHEASQGNGADTEEEGHKAAAGEGAQDSGSGGNGELTGRSDAQEDKAGEHESASAQEHDRDEAIAPQTVAEAEEAKRAGSTTLH